MAEYEWQPLTPRDAVDLLAGLAAPWWIAGGWAIDLFAGRATREHGDLDIALLRGSEPALREHFRDWDMKIAHDGSFEDWAGDALVPPRHQFWARPRINVPWALEFLLEDCEGDTWRYRREPSVTLPIARLTRTNDDGVPYLCPEVVLLYKAKEASLPRNARDFEVAAPLLDGNARRWLRGALDQAHPGHRWIELLSKRG